MALSSPPHLTCKFSTPDRAAGASHDVEESGARLWEMGVITPPNESRVK